MTIYYSFPSALTFAKPSGNNVLQPSPLHGSGCNTLLPLGLANVNAWKRMFYPLINYGICQIMNYYFAIKTKNSNKQYAYNNTPLSSTEISILDRLWIYKL